MEYPIEEKIYTRTDLVTFGNYLLSKERNDSFQNGSGMPEKNFEELKLNVHHADIENWQELNGNEINASVIVNGMLQGAKREYLLAQLGETQNDLAKVHFLLRESKDEKDSEKLLQMKAQYEERVEDIKEILAGNVF